MVHLEMDGFPSLESPWNQGAPIFTLSLSLSLSVYGTGRSGADKALSVKQTQHSPIDEGYTKTKVKGRQPSIQQDIFATVEKDL